ncbi:MAG TPA: DNA-directed RNA polymerase subunit beta [Candidatus Lumbricidophila sp.]|nr:DNA-directed RNA polymerase subunit beta [Candidatus Lumbricidophila sp.]
MRAHPRPKRVPSTALDGPGGGEDPAFAAARAHEVAEALLARVRHHADPELVRRVLTYVDEHGIDTIAELFAEASSHSLPGALWRVYLLRAAVRADAPGIALAFRRGVHSLPTIDVVIAGAPTPTGPEELLDLADTVLRGVFTGDFATALDRAAAFARIASAGLLSLADDADASASVHPDRPADLTTRASRLAALAADLGACAKLARRGRLFSD